MRTVTFFTLCAVFLFCGNTLGSTQSSRHEVLSAASGIPRVQSDVVQTSAKIHSTDIAQNNAGQQIFFAFDPSNSPGVNVAGPSDNQNGSNDVVVGSKNGGPRLPTEQPYDPLQTFFPFDPAFMSSGN